MYSCYHLIYTIGCLVFILGNILHTFFISFFFFFSQLFDLCVGSKLFLFSDSLDINLTLTQFICDETAAASGG